MIFAGIDHLKTRLDKLRPLPEHTVRTLLPVEARLPYYDALDTAHTRGDYAPFIALIAELEQATLKRYLSVILGEDV